MKTEPAVPVRNPSSVSSAVGTIISICPELKKNRENKEDEEERLAAVAYEHSTFATYQVNAIGYTGFQQTEVLLDNQANISIMHPRLSGWGPANFFCSL